MRSVAPDCLGLQLFSGAKPTAAEPGRPPVAHRRRWCRGPGTRGRASTQTKAALHGPRVARRESTGAGTEQQRPALAACCCGEGSAEVDERYLARASAICGCKARASAGASPQAGQTGCAPRWRQSGRGRSSHEQKENREDRGGQETRQAGAAAKRPKHQDGRSRSTTPRRRQGSCPPGPCPRSRTSSAPCGPS